MTEVNSSNAGAAAVEVLARAGVRRAYTVPGESFLEILDAIEQHPEMSLISTRHESGASFMAEADAKLTGVPAVAMATRGVGASNLAIGVHTAYQDSTPMLVLLGQVETTFLSREAFQEVDLPAFYSQITKWAATVPRADRIPEFVARGLRIATSGRPGPVMLALPSDLLGEDILANANEQAGTIRTGSPTLEPEDAYAIARRVGAARRPVLIAGGGARNAREELIAFAESYNVGVYASFRRQDVFPNDHPQYLGHLTLGTPPDTLRALEQADLVLVVGCRLSEITTQGYKLPEANRSSVIQIDIDPDQIGAVVPVDFGVVVDARAALGKLAAESPSPRRERDWAEGHRAYLESRAIPDNRAKDGLDPAQVVGALLEILPENAILTNDAGNFSAFVHRHWPYNHPLTQLAPTSGAMGYGVPAAVAAKLGAPDRCVVATAGDGGFLMTGQELETAVRYRAPIIIVVFRNGMHGTIAMHQLHELGRTAGTEIGNVDLAGYARSLGAEGYTVREPDELLPALERAIHDERVAVVDVVTDPDVLSPSARLSKLMERGYGT